MRLRSEDVAKILARKGYRDVSVDTRIKSPVVECPVGDGALGPRQGEGSDSKRLLVRVTSFRCRLLDEDNLAIKYHVDCCRYAGIIPGDAPGQAKIEACQRKVKTKAEEGTLVEVLAIES